MKIALCCNDTRGGVEPYAILGGELRQRGHDVVLIAPTDFASYAARFGLGFQGISGSQKEVAEVAASLSEKGALAAAASMFREMPRRIETWTKQMLEGADGADLLVGGIGGMVTGIPVAQKLGRPFLEAHLQPIGVRSTRMNGILLGNLPDWIGPYGRLLSQQLSDLALSVQFGPAMRMARKAIAAPSRATPTRLPRLFAFSEHVVPDVNRYGTATGYWQPAAQEWTPPLELADFLRTEKPLVIVGFGSIASKDPGAMISMVSEISSRLNCRIIYLSGWTATPGQSASADVFHLREAPHAWLFPKVNAVVHHGGAGTTGAAFLAGVPQVIIPTGVDQPYWASRAAALEVGLAGPSRRKMNGSAIASLLTQVLSGKFGANAKGLAQLLASEDGSAAAAHLIEGRGAKSQLSS